MAKVVYLQFQSLVCDWRLNAKSAVTEYRKVLQVTSFLAREVGWIDICKIAFEIGFYTSAFSSRSVKPNAS